MYTYFCLILLAFMLLLKFTLKDLIARYHGYLLVVAYIQLSVLIEIRLVVDISSVLCLRLFQLISSISSVLHSAIKGPVRVHLLVWLYVSKYLVKNRCIWYHMHLNFLPHNVSNLMLLFSQNSIFLVSCLSCCH